MKSDYMELKKRIKGSVFTQSDEDFKQARVQNQWNNYSKEHKHDIIVVVSDDKDVVTAINYARENKLKVSVRGGGRSWCSHPLTKGHMLVDLSNLNEVTIDKASMTASVQPFNSNRKIANLLAEQGLAYPVGHCPDVKLSGYHLKWWRIMESSSLGAWLSRC